MAHHILITDPVPETALDVLRQAKDVTFEAPGKMDRDQVLASVGKADGMIIRSGVKVDADILAAGTQLKAIARAGVGVDNVDLAEATKRGIAVMNTPAGNSIAVAELAIGLMLALARNIPAAHNSLASGQWDRKTFMGTELREKTLGMIGFGRIGQAVAKRAAAFEMRVLAYDPLLPDAARIAKELGAEMVDLDTLYAQSDYIGLHAVVTPETRGMINKNSIAKMKKGVRLVNVARGALIVPEDLAEAIKSGQVAGAALDVYDPEPPPAGYPLIGLPGVVHVPHLGASSKEAQVAVGVEAATLVVAALVDGIYQNVVNQDVLKK
jgi:D-3-phosphoglycerate dehydrogenase